MDKIVADILKKQFGKHFWNQIKMVNSYKELPKEFRISYIFGPSLYEHYEKLGQFFYIGMPKKSYLILIPGDTVKNTLGEKQGMVIMDNKGRNISPFEVESELKISFMGVGIKDLLKYYAENRAPKFRKIEESDVQRLVKRILKEDKSNNLGQTVIDFLESELEPNEGWLTKKQYRKELEENGGEIFLHYGLGEEEDENWSEDSDHLWYSICDNKNLYEPLEEPRCPVALIPANVYDKLDAYFGDTWKTIFKKWFENKTGFPVTNVDSLANL